MRAAANYALGGGRVKVALQVRLPPARPRAAERISLVANSGPMDGRLKLAADRAVPGARQTRRIPHAGRKGAAESAMAARTLQRVTRLPEQCRLPEPARDNVEPNRVGNHPPGVPSVKK